LIHTRQSISTGLAKITLFAKFVDFSRIQASNRLGIWLGKIAPWLFLISGSPSGQSRIESEDFPASASTFPRAIGSKFPPCAGFPAPRRWIKLRRPGRPHRDSHHHTSIGKSGKKARESHLQGHGRRASHFADEGGDDLPFYSYDVSLCHQDGSSDKDDTSEAAAEDEQEGEAETGDQDMRQAGFMPSKFQLYQLSV
jgi:hypothetical protein